MQGLRRCQNHPWLRATGLYGTLLWWSALSRRGIRAVSSRKTHRPLADVWSGSSLESRRGCKIILWRFIPSRSISTKFSSGLYTIGFNAWLQSYSVAVTAENPLLVACRREYAGVLLSSEWSTREANATRPFQRGLLHFPPLLCNFALSEQFLLRDEDRQSCREWTG